MKIEHFAIWARDIERLKDFYVQYFGAIANDRYVNEKKQYQSYFLCFGDGARLELMQRPDIAEHAKQGQDAQYFGYAHMAISVGSEDKVDIMTQKLVADGYTRLDGPRETGDGYYESVVQDPEGNRIEITV